MPVVEFKQDLGRNHKKGDVKNLPQMTLKAMARSAGMDDWREFAEVKATGSASIKYMIEHNRKLRIESVHKTPAGEGVPKEKAHSPPKK